MANDCYYTMVAVSHDIKNLERLLKIMNYKDDRYYIYRCFEANDNSEISTCSDKTKQTLYSVEITGYVAWSCFKWFESVEDQSRLIVKKCDSYGDTEYGTAHYITLDLLCKKLGIGIEVFSEESGCCFQEHYHVNHKGEILCNECVEWHEIWCDEDGNELDEYYTEGGFEYYCDFMTPAAIYG